ncbi:MAG: hypothetical protein AAFN04_12220 [Pseudomonadota bacterium]
MITEDNEELTVTSDLEFMDSSVISIAPGPDSMSNYVIDDPVTGAGNEDLWIVDEDEDPEDTGADPPPSEASS